MGISAIAGAIKDPSALKRMFGFEPILLGPDGDEVVIDVLEAENISYSYDISTDPIESGSEIADHINELPPTLTLDCVLTDMMWSLTNIVSGLINGNLSLHTWRDKKDALYKIKDAMSVVNISTPLDSYTDYIIESIDTQKTVSSGDCFRCRISLRHVKFVARSTFDINTSDLPVDLQGSAAENAKSDKAKTPSNKGSSPPSDGTTPTDSSAGGVKTAGTDFGAYL